MDRDTFSLVLTRSRNGTTSNVKIIPLFTISLSVWFVYGFTLLHYTSPSPFLSILKHPNPLPPTPLRLIEDPPLLPVRLKLWISYSPSTTIDGGCEWLRGTHPCSPTSTLFKFRAREKCMYIFYWIIYFDNRFCSSGIKLEGWHHP